MNQQNGNGGGTCCFNSKPAVDPLAMERVVTAGEVCRDGACGETPAEGGCALYTIYFPFQAYRAGFCPDEALKNGTLFPELISPYPTCEV